ncbi:MAG TPA: hypothetical protein VFT00_04355 [Nocardioides sp.]|nr:hypothetical protein [Nocardioides sp.]
MSTNLRISGTPLEPAPSAAASDPFWSAGNRVADARSLLLSFLIWGAVIYIAGSVIDMLAGPGGSGAAFWDLLSGLTLASGGCLVAIAVIGFGVKYGREASDVAPPPR